MKWLGLTGNLGTGKSTVAKYLRKSGCAVIDADEVARQALAKGSPLLSPIKQYFGSEIFKLDGEIDRKALGQRVFVSKEDLSWLESLVHPYVQSQVQALKKELSLKGHRLAFYDVPLLFEKKLESQFDKVITVSSDLDSIYERVQNRDGLSRKEIDERLSNQLPIHEKIKRSDYVIKNYGSLKDLENSIDQVLNQLKLDLNL